MKILITGALGHIGSRLARTLPYELPNCQIVMIDNLLTQRFSSLFELPAIGSYHFEEVDVSKTDLVPLLKGVDVVIHLAAITDAAGSFDRAAELEANNYNSTKRIATACTDNGIKLITLSSTSVYGTQELVVDETCSQDQLQPQSPYATTKLKEEGLVRDLFEKGGLRAITLRFGTIYGISPGMRFHTAVNKFCWQSVMRQPISVWSTAYDQKRPYLELNDACRALAHIIRNDIFDGDVYNVLTQNSTVRDVVGNIREFVPDLTVDFVDSKIMNQLSYEVSRKKFEDTGFSFTGDLRRGIGETIGLLKNY